MVVHGCIITITTYFPGFVNYSEIEFESEIPQDKDESDFEEIEETAQEKKLRLAKQYLAQVEEQCTCIKSQADTYTFVVEL